jgi:hypothetical protein
MIKALRLLDEAGFFIWSGAFYLDS